MIGGTVEPKKPSAPAAALSLCPIAFDGDGNMCDCDARCAWRVRVGGREVCAVAAIGSNAHRLVAAVNDTTRGVGKTRR